MLSPQHFTQIRSAFVTYGEETEVEFRLGSFYRGRYQGGVDKRTFDRFLSYFAHLPKTEETVEDFIEVNIRKRVLLARPEKEESTIWLSKTLLEKSFDSSDYPFRLSISRERVVSPLPDFSYDVIRHKQRFSYLLTGGLFRLDLTRVEETGRKESKTRLEVELEILSPSFSNQQLEKTLVFLLSLLLDSNYLYTEKQKEGVLQQVNRALGGRNPHLPRIDPGVLVQTRNLKIEDMVWGGLLGNPQTTYLVTHKADGIRKLLVVNKEGVWLIMPPNEVNLVKIVTDPNVIGTILDGEFIPASSRTGSLPRTKYWYLAFDCLSYPVPGGRSYNTSIQERDLITRMKCCQVIADRNKDETLYVNSKSYFDFHNPEGFYERMREMFAQQPSLGYKQDGFIFSPLNVPYNPDSEKFPIYERVLTKIPDFVKWKPSFLLTVDLAIRWIATREGRKKVEVLTSQDGRLIPFVGDKRYPLTGIETEGLEDLPTNSIVEFRIDAEKNILIPLRLREKLKPNRKEVALDIWKDAHSPLSEQTLKGDDFVLVRRYHNRIKRELLDSLPSGSTLLDLGSGRGADVSKWRRFKLVIAVEPSRERLEELIRRSKSIGLTNVLPLQAKAEETEKILSFLSQHTEGGKVDAVSMLLSMTFFWESREILSAVVETTKQALKRGGTFLFFTINGVAVEQVFNPREGIPLTQLRLGENSITYETTPARRLFLNFPGTIIENQREPLVFLEDLMNDLNLEVTMADKEKFLTPEESIFTRLYSYGTGKLREPLLRLLPLPVKLENAAEEEEEERLVLSWTEEKLFRFASFPGQTPFFAYFKGFSNEYRNEGMVERFNLVTGARRELAQQLPSFFSALNKGCIQDLSLAKPIERERFTLPFLQRLLASHASLPLYLYPYLAEYFKVDIYLLRAGLPYFYTEQGEHAVILLEVEESIELVGAEREGGLDTLFGRDDPLLVEFRRVNAEKS